ncbi:hypothetical protein GEMRC1_011473 [Eukaryota sp. GEM-RC1]
MVQEHSEDSGFDGLFETPRVIDLARRIYWLSLDGASVNASAVDYFLQSQTNSDKVHILHSHCLTHSMNLLLNDFASENWVKELLSCTRALIKVFRNKKQITKWLLKAGGIRLRTYPLTRLCYVVMTLETILKNKESMIDVVDSEAYIQKMESTTDSNFRELLELVKQMVKSEDVFVHFWMDVQLFLSAVDPIFSLLRISDGCPAGFAAFGHFALCCTRVMVRNSINQCAKKLNTIARREVFSEELLHSRIFSFDEHIKARVVYISTSAILIARILNPALRQKNGELFSNLALYQPLDDLFEGHFQSAKDLLIKEFRQFRTNHVYLIQSATMAPHHWWEGYGSKEFPNLYHIGVRVTQKLDLLQCVNEISVCWITKRAKRDPNLQIEILIWH